MTRRSPRLKPSGTDVIGCGQRAAGPEHGFLVALVIDPGLAYDRDIARGVAEYAREAGDWRLYIEEEPSRRLPAFEAWRGQGIIASFDDAEIVRGVMSARLPVVAVGGGGVDQSCGIPFVATDNEAIGRLAAEHLLERALPQFGFYGLPAAASVWSEERRAAFARRIHQASRPCAMFDSRHESTHWSLLQHDLAEWLGSLPKPVGIMACDDARARHVLEACRSRGLRVPHDVAVIGVDDDEFICQFSDPPLSSVAQSARRVGYEAAHILDRLMHQAINPPTAGNHAAVPPLTVVPPTGVVPRRSTDILVAEDPLIAGVLKSIRERATQGLEIAEIVKNSKLSRWQLEQRFRSTFGRSIHAELLLTRLSEARRLITTTDLPLKVIAPRAGLRSTTYMATLFRRHFQTTPALLRQAARAAPPHPTAVPQSER